MKITPYRLVFALWLIALAAPAQSTPVAGAAAFSEGDRLRGSYGPYRSNNDLLYYHLDVRVDPEKQTLSGRNSIRLQMLKAGSRRPCPPRWGATHSPWPRISTI